MEVSDCETGEMIGASARARTRLGTGESVLEYIVVD